MTICVVGGQVPVPTGYFVVAESQQAACGRANTALGIQRALTYDTPFQRDRSSCVVGARSPIRRVYSRGSGVTAGERRRAAAQHAVWGYIRR